MKLLRLFYSSPNRSFYVREITRKIDEQINSVRRELANLLSIGIISSETNNNRLYYEVNQKYEYYKSLSDIFGEIQEATEEQPATILEEEDKSLKALGHVELALYTGQFTRDEGSGIDFLVVGDINPTQLQNFVIELETKEGKEIRYTVMPVGEFIYRRQINDKFLTNVLESKKQILVDKQYLITTKPSKKPAATSKEK